MCKNTLNGADFFADLIFIFLISINFSSPQSHNSDYYFLLLHKEVVG